MTHRRTALLGASLLAACGPVTAVAPAAVFAFAAPMAGAAPARAAAVSPAARAQACGNLPATTLYQARPWAQRRLDFERVWPLTEGAGAIVAVVDTGVDASQPFLRGAVRRGLDVVHGGGPASTDCDGHGTFVAGLIAGRRIPGFGFAGVAPEATILPVREANSAGNGTALTLAESIVAAVRMHARVINVSITTPVPAQVLSNAVLFALAHNVMIVAAAGNDFTQGNEVQYPAGFPGVLAVGAVGEGGQRATFSESGPNVAVAAPGTDLVGPGAGGVGLVTGGGTSYATAFVSGVAALIRSYYPKLSAAQVIRRIEVTADHPPGRLPTPGLGWGVVDPYAAVTAVLPRRAVGSAPARSQVPRPAPPRPVAGAVVTATGVGIGGSALAVGILAGAGVVRRGRQRRWRPGNLAG